MIESNCVCTISIYLIIRISTLTLLKLYMKHISMYGFITYFPMTCNNISTQRNSWNGFYCIMCSEYKTSLLVCWQKIKISCHKRRFQAITLCHFDSHKFLLKDAYLYLSEYLFPGHKFHNNCNSYFILIFILQTTFLYPMQ